MERRPLIHFFVFFLLAALGTSVNAARAQQPGAPQPRPALNSNPARLSAGNYRIAGRVVDALTGAKLARCSVQIADVKQRSAARTVASDPEGNFAFDGLAQGKYSLTAGRRGYLAQSYEEHEQFSTAIAVGPGLDSENLVFKLTAEAVLAGTVTDEAGEPVRGAQVRLFQDLDATGVRTTQQRHSVVTDDRGMYEMPELRPGAYFLAVSGHPWFAQRLPRGGSAEQSSELQALDLAYPTTFYPGVTGQDSATPIPVKGGDRLEANLTLAAQPAMRLRLNVTPGENERGINLMLSQTVFGQTESLPTQMSVGPDGKVEVDGILPGHYEATMTRYAPGQEGRPESKHFEADVAGGATELSEDGSGVGEVTVSGKVVSADGKPVTEGGISLRVPHGRRIEYGPLEQNGEFSLAVPPGSYEVVGNMEGVYIASVKASGASVIGRMLALKAGDAPRLEIATGSGHAEIEGVARRNGKPVSAVMVLLAPEDARNNEILFRRDQSDSDGTFDIGFILPGRYRLLAIDHGWDLEWANPAVLQAFLAKSTPIDVKAGDHLKENLDVEER